MNKKGDISITLLVVMAVVVAGAASFIFLTDSGKLEQKVANARALDEIYSKEEVLDFYISEILDNIKGITTKEDFVDKFRSEIGKYKDNEKYVLEELANVRIQAGEARIENGKVIVDFNIPLGFKEDDFEIRKAYVRTFEKQVQKV